MVRTSADCCLVFLHIPKTAGTTLSSSLQRSHVPSETISLNVLDKHLNEEMERIPFDRRSTARLVMGHLPYGVHRHIPHCCEYITILREPIDRVISVYKYILRTPDHVLHDYVTGEAISLEEYVESGIDQSQTENSQTKQLSGRMFDLGDDILENAKHNLEQFLVVGLTERFDETFVLVRRSLRLRMPFYITRNVSPPLQVSHREREVIRDRNNLDLELYSFAVKLFSRQLSMQGRSFPIEVSLSRVLRPVSRALGRHERVLRKLSREKRAR
jgi:hypothetical protein